MTKYTCPDCNGKYTKSELKEGISIYFDEVAPCCPDCGRFIDIRTQEEKDFYAQDGKSKMNKCRDCKHWQKWEEKPHSIGPKVLSVGDCFESSFAKTFGKQVSAHDGTCRSFKNKETIK